MYCPPAVWWQWTAMVLLPVLRAARAAGAEIAASSARREAGDFAASTPLM